MKKSAIKDVAYGGMMELLSNSRYYYRSGVGPNYSHLTDEGKQAVVDLIDMLACPMLAAEDLDLDNRARQQVLGQLKQEA